MTVNTIPAARLQFIKRLRHIEKMGILSLTHYDQNRIFDRVGQPKEMIDEPVRAR